MQKWKFPQNEMEVSTAEGIDEGIDFAVKLRGELQSYLELI